MNHRFEPRIRILLGSSIAIGPARLAAFEPMDARGRPLARKQPWQPIRFALDDLTMQEDGFRLRAAGTDGTRPFGFGLSTHIDAIEELADVGVVLLLFTIGLEFSLQRLRDIFRQVAVGGV